ncbi:glycosyl hydrolase [Pseudoclavibacter terrae]
MSPIGSDHARGPRSRAGLGVVLCLALSAAGVGGLTLLSPVVPSQSVHAAEFASFADPGVEQRPVIRYWLPSAAVDHDELRAQVAGFAESGFGVVQVVGMWDAKGVTAEYAWGSDKWWEAMKVILDEAGARGLQVDLANGKRWPISVPTIASADDPAAARELTYGTTLLEPGATFAGALPERREVQTEGTPKLESVFAYPVVDEKLVVGQAVELTSVVNTDGTLEFTPPDQTHAWQITAFWAQPTAQKTDEFYVVDHLGAEGGQANADYWEQIVLPKLGDSAQHIRALFSDSMEHHAVLEWTADLPAVFEQLHGYKIDPYLPFLETRESFLHTDAPGFDADDSELQARVLDDYYSTLTHLYMTNHLGALESMAQRNGFEQVYQVAYNKPYEMEVSASAVSIPENESRANNALDGYRTMSAAVHLDGKQYYSAELESTANNYRQSMEDLMWWTKRAWSVGVNLTSYHGASYTGGFSGPGSMDGVLEQYGDLHWAGMTFPGPKVAWPGYTAFGPTGQTSISNDWDRVTDPAALRLNMDYVARNNWVLQKPAKVDLAVYRHDVDKGPADAGDGHHIYPDGGALSSAGFSYEFVSPALLEATAPSVGSERIAPEGPAYKAVVVNNEAAMSLDAIEQLATYAEQGVRLVFVGDVPSRLVGEGERISGATDDQVAAAASKLLGLGNVTRVSTLGEVPTALAALGVAPDAQNHDANGILTQHRQDDSGDYYYLYNYNQIAGPGTLYPNIDKSNFVAKSAAFTLRGEGAPYALDPWTGEATPILEYTRDGSDVNVSLDFAGDEARIVALLTPEQASQQGAVVPSVHVVGSQGAGNYRADDGGLVVRAFENGTQLTQLSDGSEATTEVSGIQPAASITDWTLTVNSVTEGATTLFADSEWSDLGPFEVGETMKPWHELDPALAGVAGVGTYTGTFSLSGDGASGHSAEVILGEVSDSVRVKVNGVELPPLDQHNPVVDVGELAVDGVNTIEVIVGTPLWNAVTGESDPNGLLGTGGVIQVRPYVESVVVEPVLPSIDAGVPMIDGELLVGSELAATPGDWSPADLDFNYQWLSDDHPIAGATEATYRLTDSELGTRVRVQVTGVKDGFQSATAVSEATQPVASATSSPQPTPNPTTGTAGNESGGAGNGSGLAVTGADIGWIISVIMAAIAAGAGAFLWSRRGRRSAE